MTAATSCDATHDPPKSAKKAETSTSAAACMYAGAATAARGLLNMQQLEVSVRCLMVLGMLLSSSADAQQQLADDAAALQQLMELVKQNEDADCKVIARDVLGLLMREEGLRRKVEAAIRQQAEAAAAAAAQQG